MTEIPPPHWARPFQRTVDPSFGEVEFARLASQRSALLEIVHRAIEDYVNDPSLAADDDRVFPSRRRLTGEYYIGEETYWLNEPRRNGPREYRFSFMAHCLEHTFHPNQTDWDYLGLEVHFAWYPAEGRFEYSGDVDSSSI